ncbi:MAG TPA: IS1380 family transposase, partial [Mycobacterium sp.]|nr:IS1380 family transposase [Mycobacterium sp.]
AGTLAGDRHAVARGATLRRHLIAVPARLARPQRRPVLHLPTHWPWAEPWQRLWTAASDPPAAA